MAGDQAIQDPAVPRPKIFLVAVEESGDRLGAALMRQLRDRTQGAVSFAGVGGRGMIAEGLRSLHPIEGFSIIGFSSIPSRLPRVLRYLRQTLTELKRVRPDALVVIDSPGYNLLLARFAHRADPTLPIFDYVSPSIWAWRPQRASRMRKYISHVLALLPFEPDAHRRLGGPPCSYVGHPIIEEAASIRPDALAAERRLSDPPVVLVLPGSRRGEIERHSEIFGRAIGLVRERVGPIEVVVPTLPEFKARIEEALRSWPLEPRITTDPAEKRQAFRTARAALAKSGTVTLELAVAGVPMVTAYRVSALDAAILRRMLQVSTVILANLVLGEKVIPEFLQEACTPENLCEALVPLLADTPQRRQQAEAFAKLDQIMEIGGPSPARRAADIVLSGLREHSMPFAGAKATL